ncbi:MAG: BolA family protein [Armatimonadota bacterium]
MAVNAFDYISMSEIVRKAVRDALPDAFVGTDEGYLGRIHLKVVSEHFRGMTEEQKQQEIWDILKDKLGSESQSVSLAMVYGPDEL